MSVVKRKKPLLIFLNPHSGTGKGLYLYETFLRPLLTTKELGSELFKTAYAGHAKNFVRDHNDLVGTFAGIVVISGDGLVHEIINGLKLRPDWNRVSSELPLGLIPGGSGCALNCSLLKQLGQPLDGLNSLGPKSSALNVVDGASEATVADLDLIDIELENGSQYLSFLGATLGLIADCDINSEWLRCLGFLRVYLYAAVRFAFPKPYRATISYLPLVRDAATNKPVPVPAGSVLDLPKLGDPVPEDWVTEENGFHVVYAIKCSMLDPMTCFVPESELGDGVMWMVVVRSSLTQWQLFNWMSDLANGPHSDLEAIDVIPVRAFRVVPQGPMDGVLSLDAESVPFGAFQGQLISKKVKLMASASAPKSETIFKS